MRDFFYRPEEGYVGDVIPYYENGVYYLYFLYAHRNPEKYGEGTSWYLLTTRDLVHFEEHGEVLPHADAGQQDLNAFTGSVWKAGEGHYYLYYTGYNAHPGWCVQGVPLQAVMLAESEDLLHWRKLPEVTFYPSQEWYDLSDWRDPFVYWSEERREYRMLLAAREKEGPEKRRGCVGLCASEDLLHWRPQPPFYAPGLAMTHECPELFRLGDWWYLFYSSFTEDFATHYRMSRSPEGPWITPPDDRADGRAFYAGKTASDGRSRYLFGWIPTRKEERDDGPYEWAGNLIVHEIRQNPDGTLRFVLPQTVAEAFGRQMDMGAYLAREKNSRGGWRRRLCGTGSRTALKLNGAGGYACAVSAKELPVTCRISLSLRFSRETRQAGLLLLTDEEGNDGFIVRLEPDRSRMVFDRWPRRRRQPGEDAWELGGEISHYVELERPVRLTPGEPCRIQALLDGSMLAVYFNEEKVMSVRCYGRKAGRLGVFAAAGKAVFEEVTVWRRE